MTSGRDTFTGPAESAAFASRAAASYFDIAEAKHELLMEQDWYRGQVWSAFDSFVG